MPSPEQQARWNALHHFAAEAAAILNEPLHHEILRLAGGDDFQTDARWIAARAGTTVDAVNVALQRLLRLRLIAFEGPMRWVDVEGAGKWTLAEFRRRAVERVEEMASGYMEPNLARKVMPNPVVHFQIITKNPEVHGRFYQELFGWSLDDANPMGYRRIETGSQEGIQGGLWPGPGQAPNFVQLLRGVCGEGSGFRSKSSDSADDAAGRADHGGVAGSGADAVCGDERGEEQLAADGRVQEMQAAPVRTTRLWRRPGSAPARVCGRRRRRSAKTLLSLRWGLRSCRLLP